MSAPQLDDWLRAAGFDAVEADVAVPDQDDPWGALDVEVTSLSDEQRAYLSATPTFDDGPIDPDLLAAADAEIIDIPDEGDIDPF